MGSTARDTGLEKPVKKSLVIAGHATSIALEPVFWEILKNMAETQACSLPELIAAIDPEPRPACPARYASAPHCFCKITVKPPYQGRA